MSEPAFIRQREPGSRDLEYPPLPEPLGVPVYDNHTHLEIADGEVGLEYSKHLDRATSVGVSGVVQVGGDVATSRWSAALAEREPRVLAAVALHPNEVPELAFPTRTAGKPLRDLPVPAVVGPSGSLEDALAVIDELAAQPRVVAVGETGLDYFRTPEGPGREAQLRSFEVHIEIAKRHGIALQIHDRDAHSDVIATLLRVGAPERTVFHCFSGDAEMARLCAEHGWYLSFAGTVTFKNAVGLREALAVTPASRVLVETDAPFLTPHPYRGRPNAPYLLPHTVRAMASFLEVPVDEFSASVAANTEAVYGSWGLS